MFLFVTKGVEKGDSTREEKKGCSRQGVGEWPLEIPTALSTPGSARGSNLDSCTHYLSQTLLWGDIYEGKKQTKNANTRLNYIIEIKRLWNRLRP